MDIRRPPLWARFAVVLGGILAAGVGAAIDLVRDDQYGPEAVLAGLGVMALCYTLACIWAWRDPYVRRYPPTTAEETRGDDD